MVISISTALFPKALNTIWCLSDYIFSFLVDKAKVVIAETDRIAKSFRYQQQ